MSAPRREKFLLIVMARYTFVLDGVDVIEIWGLDANPTRWQLARRLGVDAARLKLVAATTEPR